MNILVTRLTGWCELVFYLTCKQHK